MNENDRRDVLDTASDSPLLHVRVREDLRRRISRMRGGEKLEPERALAERYGVDRATVRRAMTDLEQEGFVVRHQGRGTFIRKLRTIDQTRLVGPKVIGLIMPDMEIPMHLAMLRGVEEAASQRGYQCWVRNAMLDARRGLAILDAISHEELTGIITCPFFENVADPEYVRLLGRLIADGKRVVLMDEYIPQIDAPTACIDKFRVGYLAAEHLVMQGHHRIGYVSSHTYSPAGDKCYRGYRQALDDYGVAFHPELEINVDGRCSAEPVREAVRDLLRESPRAFTAVATPHFAMAYGICLALRDLGLTVGRDIALVGDNMTDNPEFAHIPHTHQPHDQEARAAVELLLDDARDGHRKHVLIQPTMVMGQNL
ncbi:MAG: LacI family transcriptional regulator [Phycisphaerae bacterium]|nr:LacI family transcriptional regulator [Phycisphaerae bacterium]